MEFHRKIHIKERRGKLTGPQCTTQMMAAMSRCFPEDHRWRNAGHKVAVNHFKGHVCLFYTNINARNRRTICSMSMSVYQQTGEFLSTIRAWQSHRACTLNIMPCDCLSDDPKAGMSSGNRDSLEWSLAKAGWAGCDVPSRENIFTDDIKFPFQFNG